ncbi:ester hydrolase c11orf54-like protein [Lasius niger]|uniref:Ester hydrolase c11orf54-like protein n=1 Tax=Lasius niger TaxID=67767 RepID=A0A0J7KEV3_LASNI|nr:ester hydrolase c11orf54-like protein [Lasius niger]
MALENQENGIALHGFYTEFTQQIVHLNLPDLSEVKNVLEPALREYFNEANVSVVPCPDLRESPFHLAAPGLSGETIIMKMGGTEFLWINPTHNMDKSCNGDPGYVLKVNAKGRRTNVNFPTAIQTGLQRRYEPNDFIGLGGTFVIKNGIVRNRLRCPSLDLNSPSELIHHTSTPLVAVGTILSRKTHTSYYFEEGLFEGNAEPTILLHQLQESEFETEVFHTFACNRVDVGGHFLNDFSPLDTEYEGYFNLATKFIRVTNFCLPN